MDAMICAVYIQEFPLLPKTTAFKSRPSKRPFDQHAYLSLCIKECIKESVGDEANGDVSPDTLATTLNGKKYRLTNIDQSWMTTETFSTRISREASTSSASIASMNVSSKSRAKRVEIWNEIVDCGLILASATAAQERGDPFAENNLGQFLLRYAMIKVDASEVKKLVPSQVVAVAPVSGQTSSANAGESYS